MVLCKSNTGLGRYIMLKNRVSIGSGILLVMVVFLLSVGVEAKTWSVRSNFSYSGITNRTVAGMATNSTDANNPTLFFMDANTVDGELDFFVLNGDGAKLFNWSSSSGFATSARGLAVGTSLPSTGWNVTVGTTSGLTIYVINQTGGVKANRTLSGLVCQGIFGLWTNANNGSFGEYWVADSNDPHSCNYNTSGDGGTTNDYDGYASFVYGFVGNFTSKDDGGYMVVSNTQAQMFEVDSNFNVLETIDLNALGISAPRWIATTNKDTPFSDVWIASDIGNMIYYVSSALPGTITGSPIANASIVLQQHKLNLSVEISSGSSLASAFLETNQTGVFKNWTGGRYGSPLSLTSNPNQKMNVSFLWINEIYNPSSGNISVSWRVHFNNSLGVRNQTSYGVFNATVMTVVDNDTSIGISDLVVDAYTNISISFNATASIEFSILLPATIGNTTFKECAYRSSGGSRIRSLNSSLNTGGGSLIYCNVTIYDLKVNSTGTIKIMPDISLTADKPSNIPSAIAAGVLVTIIVVYSYRVIRKKS